MSEKEKPVVAIVNYGMGNLFSVQQACATTGMIGNITSDFKDLEIADAVIIPGVGAFGVAMERLKSLNMIRPIQDIAASGKPMIGICLGFQLMMEESSEFGNHKGLSLFSGQVQMLHKPVENNLTLKVPHIGWSRIYASDGNGDNIEDTRDEPAKWKGSLLEFLTEGKFMYFVHSYYVETNDKESILSDTQYGHIKFCSAMQKGNLFGCQFHPERSGKKGLQVYRNLASYIKKAQVKD